MKKSYVLFVMMLLGLFTVSASAVESTSKNVTTYTEGVYTYTITDGEVSIIDVDEESISGDVILPETLGNCPVVTLEGGQYYDGFYYCEKITSIHIPKTIKSVGTAFYFVPNLKSITVDENNPYLTAIDGVLYNKEVTQMLVYPSGKEYADFVVPASVKWITGFQNSGSSKIKTLSFEQGSQLEAFEGDSLFYFTYIDELIIPPNCSIENVSTGYSCFVQKLTFEEGREEEVFVDVGGAPKNIDIPATFVGIAEFALMDTGIPTVTIRNPECNIYDSPNTLHSDITIYGYEGSTAHAYARKYNRNFIDLNGKVIDETKYKVKIEFRFADTKEIIDTSAQYTLDRQVSFNFTTTEDVHRMLNATNGILYMDDFYFPINYFNASWSSAFGDRTEYSCKSTKIIDANAGDTIVVYMSPIENQGSVTTKLAGGKTNNYGAHNAVSTIEGQIRETAKELAEYIDEYILLINGSKLNKKNNNTEEPMQKSANALKNASARDKIYAVPPKAEFEYALCYALATVFKEETEEKIDLGKINLDKSKEEIALNLTKKLLSNFSEVDQTVTCGNYKVKINLTMFGKAFTGSYYIYNKKGNILYGPGLVNSSQDSTKATLKAYYMSMSNLVNDMLKASMASIFTELSDVTGLTDYRESALNDSVKNALSYLEKNGFGKVKDLLMTGREIYISIKDIASATSDLTVSNLLKTEEKTRELYEIVFNNSFTSSKASDAAAKEIISKIEATRKELYNLLYNKLYGINRDDAGVLTKVGNWIEAKILCPVDVEVYNENGELIGYVDTLGRHDEFIYYSDGIYIEVRGDEKFIYYPLDKTVTLKFFGTDNGSMTYSLETLVDGESVNRFNYYNVALSEGCEYSQTIEADTGFSDSMDALVLIGDSETYTGEYLSVDDETAHIRALYFSTEGGKVSGDTYYPKGDCATLYAYAQEGYEFKGWYENEKCIFEEEVYRFAATRDVVLEAKFEEIEESVIEDEDPAVLDRIILSENELVLKIGEHENLNYIAIPSASNVNIQWVSDDSSIATVDENGTVTAVAKGATTVSAVDTATNISVQCRVVVDDESSCVYLGHEFKDWYYVDLADCETDGLEQRGCTYCDCLETRPISAIGHSYESVVTQATCKDKGYTTYTCVCGDSYIGDYVNTIDHKYTAKVTTQATHLTQGIKTYTCDCGTCYTETIAKLPDHTYIKVINLPTCTSEGYTTYICDCGDTYTGDKTPAKGHDYAEGVCKNCGDSKVDNCSCNCHKSGLMGIIWKILRFFYKLFKINPVCGCGVSHY